MKLSAFTLVALAAGTLVTAAPVAAQRHVEMHRTVTTETRDGIRTVRHDDRDMRSMRHMRRHKVCRTRWSNHHRVTRCFWR